MILINEKTHSSFLLNLDGKPSLISTSCLQNQIQGHIRVILARGKVRGTNYTFLVIKKGQEYRTKYILNLGACLQPDVRLIDLKFLNF